MQNTESTASYLRTWNVESGRNKKQSVERGKVTLPALNQTYSINILKRKSYEQTVLLENLAQAQRPDQRRRE
jgi:hypothetical protein